jgi:hypothetical protein
VTENFFALLGVQPAIGRSFTASKSNLENMELAENAEVQCWRSETETALVRNRRGPQRF